MNRAQRMLQVLKDGQAHSRRDLFERCGFFLTNNAAAELRAQGYDVRQERKRVNGDNVYFYRLVDSLSERDPQGNGTLDSAGPESSRSLSKSDYGAPLEEKFWNRVEKSDDPDGCWTWKGTVNHEGYGRLFSRVHLEGRDYIPAHRYAYETFVGPIPDGLVIDHLCRNTRCVNPAHLEPVTSGENVLRGVGITAQEAKQTHCKRGHEFTEENTLRVPTGRICRTCQRMRQRVAWKRASLSERVVTESGSGDVGHAPLGTPARSESEATSGLSVSHRSPQDEPAHEPNEDGRLEQTSLKLFDPPSINRPAWG